MHPEVKGLLEVYSIEEADQYLRDGWILVHTTSVIEGDKPKYFFVLGKSANIRAQEQIAIAELTNLLGKQDSDSEE